MSTEREVTRIVRSWLHEDAHEDADRILNLVLDEIDTTPQRSASWLARRFAPMNNVVKIAVVVAAVLVIAFAGFRLLRPDSTGNPVPTATQSAVPLPPPGQLDAGRYVMTMNAPVPFTFSVPAGWSSNSDGFVSKHLGESGEIAFTSFYEFPDIFGNACHWSGTLVAVTGMSVESMANALAAQEEQGSSAPSNVTLGGYQGKRVVLSEPDGFDFTACDEGTARLWPDMGGDVTRALRVHQPQQDAVYILDVQGRRMVLVTWQFPGTSEADITEMEGIFASIQFEP